MERERQRKREQERRRREAQVNELTISNVVQMFIMHELSEGIYQEKTEPVSYTHLTLPTKA